jgi:hypothetical protein
VELFLDFFSACFFLPALTLEGIISGHYFQHFV